MKANFPGSMILLCVVPDCHLTVTWLSLNSQCILILVKVNLLWNRKSPNVPCCHEHTVFVAIQSLSLVWLFATPWTAACQASLSITNSCSMLKLMPIKSVMPSNHLILCHPLLLLPSIFPSSRVLSIESVLCIRWPKYWSFSYSISPSNEYSGLISFKIDWFDLLAVRGTLKSRLQHHNSKASIFPCSAFLRVQLSHPYILEKPQLWLDRPLLAK